MRLLNLHIENFGALSDVDIDFNDKINTVFHDNGWGKSTLAEFIRIMFYGIEGSRKKEFLENDRNRFQPWNGKHFGGELSFEVDGKMYKIERNFGTRDKDMTFKLYDLVTMIESDDYTQKIGEELFGVDSDSFRKTCFVGMGGATFTGINSAIGAKVSAVDEMGDLDNYDVADKRLSEYMNINSPSRKTGELYKLKSAKEDLKLKLSKKDSVVSRIEGIKKNRSDVEAEIKAIYGQQSELLELQKKSSEQKQIYVKLENLSSLKNDVEIRKKSLDEKIKTLPNPIPNHTMIEAADAKLQEYSEFIGKKKSFDEKQDSGRYSRLERFFESGVPNVMDVNGYIENFNNIQNLIQKNETLESLIEAGKEREQTQRKLLEEKRAQSAGKKRSMMTWAGVCIIACVIFCILAVFVRIKFFFFLTGLAGIAAVICLLMRSMQDKIVYDSSLPNYTDNDAHEKKIRENREEINRIEDTVKRFLSGYNIAYSRLDAESMLYDIKAKITEYNNIKEEMSDLADQRKSIDKGIAEVEVQLRELLNRIGIMGSTSDIDTAFLNKKLSDMNILVNAYEIEIKELERAEEKLNKYRADNPELADQEGNIQDQSGNIIATDITQELDIDYDARLRELSDNLSEKQALLSKYDRELENAYEEYDEAKENEDRLSELEEEYKILSDRYNVVEKTKEYLGEAKELFISKYMSPIKDSFDKYYAIISGDTDIFRIDANVNLTRKEEGSFHDIVAQSEGYGEAIGICMRLALLKTMYKKEKPFIVLDDPFSSMDEHRLTGTKKLLQKVSEEYQIIYMTCHESRVIGQV